MSRAASRPARVGGARPVPCVPTGDLCPWDDDRPRTCTVCAEFVDVLPFPDGSDWYAVDATGSPAGRALMPPLCPCPANDGLRGVDPPRWYGAMIPSAAWRGGFHMHNARGGQVFYTDLSAAPMACGHRLPPVRRALPIEPFGLAGPACCGAPMRWVPRGWACRTSGQVFDAVEEAAA